MVFMFAAPSPHPDSSHSCCLGGAGMSYDLNSPVLGLYATMRALWPLSTCHDTPCGSTALPLSRDGNLPGGGGNCVYFSVFGSMRPTMLAPGLTPSGPCSFSLCSLIHATPCESTEMSWGKALRRKLNSIATYFVSVPLSKVLGK